MPTVNNPSNMCIWMHFIQPSYLQANPILEAKHMYVIKYLQLHIPDCRLQNWIFVTAIAST